MGVSSKWILHMWEKHGTAIFKWMMTGGSPISGNRQDAWDVDGILRDVQ